MILNILRDGDFFGEVAALTGSQRTANVITEEESEYVVFPSKVMRNLTRNYEELVTMFQTIRIDRLSMIDQPRGMGLDQQLLRELRTSQPDMETEPTSTDVAV